MQDMYQDAPSWSLYSRGTSEFPVTCLYPRVLHQHQESGVTYPSLWFGVGVVSFNMRRIYWRWHSICLQFSTKFWEPQSVMYIALWTYTAVMSVLHPTSCCQAVAMQKATGAICSSCTHSVHLGSWDMHRLHNTVASIAYHFRGLRTISDSLTLRLAPRDLGSFKWPLPCCAITVHVRLECRYKTAGTQWQYLPVQWASYS